MVTKYGKTFNKMSHFVSLLKIWSLKYPPISQDKVLATFFRAEKRVFNCWNIYDGAIKITKAWKIGYKVFNRKIYRPLATIHYWETAHEANVEAIEDVVDKRCLAASHQGYTRKRRKIRPSKPQMSFCTKNSLFIGLYL